jgi:type I restriction enzyme S subunit
MSDFFDTTIGEQLTLQRGFDITKKQQVPGDVPVVSSGGVASYHNESKVQGPGVVLGRKGTLGTVFYIEEDYWPHDTSLWVKDFKGNNPRFVYYFFRSIATTIKKMDVGAANPALNRNHVHPMEVKWPVRKVQDRIVQILSKLDDKIELNHQTNQTLEHIAQAIFKSWFVDFEPTRAKIAAKKVGQNPERAAMAAISGKPVEELDQLSVEQQEQLKTTAALFPDALVASELGEIPEGWEAKAFGELLSKTIGGDWGKEEPDEKHTEKVKILRGTDLPSVYAGSDEKVPTRFVDPKKLATRKIEAGDIVIEVSGGSKDQPTGRSLFLTREIIDRLNSDLEPASFCRLFRPINIEVGLMLGLHLQKIYADGKTWQYQNQSTGISNFQTKVFLERELVVVPKQDLVPIFFNSVMPFLQNISSAENQNLEKTRDTLLPKLLSGELTI